MFAIDRSDLESTTTNENDGDLSANHDTVDADKEEVALKTSEDVELVVQTAVVEFVEDLHPDKSVEDHGVKLELLRGVVEVVFEDASTGEVENESDNQLEDRLSDDHLPHVHCNEWCFLAGWFAFENDWSWWIGGKCESCEGIHDQVDPKKLHSCKYGMHIGIGYSRDERK